MALMTEAILLLDIDGVLSPFPFSAERSSDWKFEPEFISCVDGRMFRLTLSKEMGQAIAGLGCGIRWLTTWCDHAHPNVGQHFGWPKYPVAGRPRGMSDFTWKPATVFDLVHKHSGPLVWIEDEAEDYYEGYLKRAFEQTPLDNPDRLIIVGPESKVGLTKDALEYVQDRLSRLATL